MLLGDVWEQEKQVPLCCPECNSISIHVFFHTFGAFTLKASSWVWCDTCFIFEHLTTVNPPWWINVKDSEKIEDFSLDFYNEIKDFLDEHLNRLSNAS